MKVIRIILTILLITNYQSLITLKAQIAINTDGTTPDASAMLDVSSTDKGILIPRMTTAERTAISNPATGLMVYDNDENSFWYFNGSDWTVVGSSSTFTSENGITSSNNNNDDFVFGADSINYGSGYEYKFFFDKSKGAFRAGEVRTTDWDEGNLGYNSVAFGQDNLVSNSYSFSMGENNEVTESYAHAFGEKNIISEEFSTAFGEDNNISGYNSFASGESLTISGDYSTAFGYNSEISSDYSMTFGYDNVISGDFSVAFGEDNTISEEYSFATGDDNTISGRYANALGRNLIVPSYAEIAIGSFNTTYTPNATTSFDNSDRLFVIGNGRSVVNRSDAMIVYKNGNTAINGQLAVADTVNLSSALMVNGKDISNAAFSSVNGLTTSFNNTDDFLFGGDSLNYGGNGDEYKFFFAKSKGAFRAGMIDETDWDESNLGEYSTAFGENSIVSGDHSFAGGKEHTISGEYATAFGEENEISDDYSFAAGLEHIIDNEYAAAFGYYNQLSGYASFAGGEYHDIDGDYSTAFGQDHVITGSNVFGAGDDNVISGNYAIALGRGLEVPSRSEVAVGAYNTTYTPTNATSFNDADRLFVIGNGASIANRSDAMIVYKSGNTAINGQLAVSDTVNLSSALIVNGKDLANTAFTSENNLITAVNNSDDFLLGESMNYGNNSFEYKLFFDISKGSLRGGSVNTTNWDQSNLGENSIGFGYNNLASGNYSAALGYNTEASGAYAIAAGYSTYATGQASTAFGTFSTASGKASVAIGVLTTAPSYAETVFGIYNTSYNQNSANSFNSEDRLFVIGNGTGSSARSDAMIVYKSGDTEINGALTLNNAFTFPTTDGSANQFLTTDGSGSLSWTDQVDLTGNVAIGTASAGSESTFQNNSSATNDGFLTTPWIYTNAIEATGERGTSSTAITIGDDGNFGANDEIHLVTKGNSVLVVDSDQDVQINGQASVVDEKSGTDNYVMIIENTKNDNSSDNDGLLIIAGHDSYNSSNQSSLLRFHSPNGTNLGRIQQNGTSDISFINSSDVRLKENIQPTEFGIEDILKIEVRDYNFKTDPDEYVTTGFLAQQLHTIFPTAVTVGDDKKTNPWGVDYARLTPLLVKGIQDQQQIINQQQVENESLKKRVAELEKQQVEVKQLKAQVSKINELEAKLETLLQNQ